jgi:hypothetical protein
MVIVDLHIDLEPLIYYSQIDIFHLRETSISQVEEMICHAS